MKEFEFGFSRRNINPPMKMGLAGYFNTRIWEKVLDQGGGFSLRQSAGIADTV